MFIAQNNLQFILEAEAKGDLSHLKKGGATGLDFALRAEFKQDILKHDGSIYRKNSSMA